MAFKGLVKFREDKCKGCELCVSACPKKIIKLRESAINALGYRTVGIDDMEACAACANCALMCPDGAIAVYKANQEGQK